SGVVVEAGSPDSLAWGVVHVLEQPRLSRRRADVAQAKVATEYNWDAIADKTIAIYQRILSSSVAMVP
ncbi:MAG: glycosyltransferase, partial [Chloroflexota bacterium]